MTASPEPRLLKAGGTLAPGHDLYVSRPEDALLLELLLAGEYCNILTSRQMGKSSLVAQAAHELDERQVRVVQIDLQNLSTPASLDDWYQGLLMQIARDLDLRSDVRAWWSACPWPTPNQRLLAFFEEQVLGQVESRIVVFVDEIDWTLKLPYTDDLFAAIRSMYNQRGKQPAYKRLAFCLVGVASPNELIKNKLTTPYNVGRTLELRDFDPDRDDLSELHRAVCPADPARGAAIVSAVLAWTGGHPYLTTSLCRRFAEQSSSLGDAVAAVDQFVDQFVQREFVRHDVVPEDEKVHFQRVTEYLGERAHDKLATLQLYRRIRRGRSEPDRSTQLHIDLKLSGIVKRNRDGRLVVRNRIYERLFTDQWAKSTMPTVERQVRLARATVKWALALTLLITVGAVWAIRSGKDRDVIEGAVLNLPVASADNVHGLLDNLRRRPDYAAEQLRAAYDAEKEPSKKLRLAYGLIAVAAVRVSTDDVGRFVLDHIQHVPPDDNRLFVEALSRLTDVERVTQELHTHSDPKGAVDQNGAVDEEEIVVRTRRALAAVSLGRMEAAERLQVADGDPTQRTVFIRDFSKWPIRPPEEFAAFLSRNQAAEVRSGLCIALGGVNRNRWTEEERTPVREQLLRLCQDDPDSGVHSAAGWALKEWQIALPDLSRRATPSSEPLAGDRSWFVNSLGMTMVQVPKDEKRKYRIGSKLDDDNPVREVEVARIWLSACEVTVGQFGSLQSKDDSKDATLPSTDALELIRPVTGVTWYDAVNYCNLLSEREGFQRPYYYEISDIQRDTYGHIESAKVKSGVGHGYRLPTEVEWEVACRAGTTTEYSFGNQEGELSDYGWFGDNTGDAAKPVASKRPNPWGMHDMHGNVWEWCEDAYDPGATPGENPDRVVRGGSWYFRAGICRSAFRLGYRAVGRNRNQGFRVCLVSGPVAVPNTQSNNRQLEAE